MKRYIICLVLIKNKIAVFRLPARAAEICPCENELRLQPDFDLRAVELDSTPLASFLPSMSIHSPNIYWAPTIARHRAGCLGRATEGGTSEDE